MKLRQYARSNRKNPTDAERKLWSQLRNRQLMASKFRRQVPIGSYIVDFLCLESKLVIELDGSQHLTQIQYDQTRTRYLESQGYRVIRFFNDEVLQNMEGVLERVLIELDQPSP